MTDFLEKDKKGVLPSVVQTVIASLRTLQTLGLAKDLAQASGAIVANTARFDPVRVLSRAVVPLRSASAQKSVIDALMGAVLKGMELKGGPPLSVPEFVKKHRLAKEHRLPHKVFFKAPRYYTGPVRKHALLYRNIVFS